MARRLIGADGPPIVPHTGWSASLTTLAALAMGFLAVLTLAGALAADRLGARWAADLAGAATVRIPGIAEDAEAALAAALEVLETTPGITSFRALSDDEQRALLEPWFGEAIPMADLPVPRLVEVVADPPGPDPTGLQRRLDAAVPGAIYDDHAAWRTPLTDAAAGLRRLALGATLAVAIAAGAMIALAARATLAGNAEVVRTVRLVGGEDRFIAGAFVRRLTARAFAGGAIGSAIGLVLVGRLPDLAARGILGTDILPGPWSGVVLAGSVALGAGLIAWVTVRITIRIALRRIL